jgi:polyphosphate kinase 2 (PPK2 family)
MAKAPTLSQVDLEASCSKNEYRDRLRPLQGRLLDLQYACRDQKLGSLVVLGGWDMSGKGDCVNKLTQRLEPRGFKLHLIQAPRTHYRGLPWLWRFWMRIPPYGHMAIFQQSWYRQVLKRRFRGSVEKKEWKTSLVDIRSFEKNLLADRYVIAKIFLHLSREEQGRRLEELSQAPEDAWRIDDEDWAQYEDYDAYGSLVDRVLKKTHTKQAPWNLVAANDIRHARLQVLEIVAETLERGLSRRDLEVPAQRAEAAS